jgi:hypothetical protein
MLAENCRQFSGTEKDDSSENEHVERNSPRTPNAKAQDTRQFHLREARPSLSL